MACPNGRRDSDRGHTRDSSRPAFTGITNPAREADRSRRCRNEAIAAARVAQPALASPDDGQLRNPAYGSRCSTPGDARRHGGVELPPLVVAAP